VRVAEVAPSKPRLEFVLPGQATPFLSTPIYAKATAYVQRNHVDLGDRVKRGQLLAELIAPENDEAVRVAEARFAEAKANVEIARRTAERNAQLADVGVVPRERADDTLAHANSAVAALNGVTLLPHNLRRSQRISASLRFAFCPRGDERRRPRRRRFSV
jgi:multidrug efflux pump subunit AcrA (membrane-fusion protein)